MVDKELLLSFASKLKIPYLGNWFRRSPHDPGMRKSWRPSPRFVEDRDANLFKSIVKR